MRRSNSSNTKLWAVILGVFFIGTLLFLSFRPAQEADDLDFEKTPQLKSTSSSPSQYRIPLYNRNGQQVVARFDNEKTHITELNVTTYYTDLNGKRASTDVFVMATTTNPPFAAVVANPHFEAASSDVYQNGDMEIPTRKLFEFILKQKCKSGDHLVVDAGANLGYFSTYSAVMGCRVIAFEPQPRLLPIITASTIVNGITDRYELHNNIVTTDRNARLKIVYAGGSCTGCSRVSAAQPGEKNTDSSFIIDAVRIDDVVKEDVLLMKVDVEGYEVLALESARGVFKKYNVQNVLVEWFPSRFPHSVEQGDKLMEWFADQGYTIRHYDLRFDLPRDWVEAETFPIAGNVWKIPREKIRDVNEHLTKQSYGEANLWFSKEH